MMTEQELTEEMDRCGEDLDGLAPFDALMNIADHLDMDLARTCAKIKYGRPLTEDEALVAILLESSQSNLPRSLRMIQRMYFAEQMIGMSGLPFPSA